MYRMMPRCLSSILGVVDCSSPIPFGRGIVSDDRLLAYVVQLSIFARTDSSTNTGDFDLMRPCSLRGSGLIAITVRHYRIDRTPSCGRIGKQLRQSLLLRGVNPANEGYLPSGVTVDDLDIHGVIVIAVTVCRYDRTTACGRSSNDLQIGRASCRERV